MVKKIFGYVIAIVGIAAFGLTFESVAKAFGLPVNLGIGLWPLTGISLAILAVGVFFVVKGGSSTKMPAEVPIYEGKNIVGYRRMSKK